MKKQAAIITLGFLIVGLAILSAKPAAAAGETLHPDQATADNPNIAMGDLKNVTILDTIDSFFLSVTSSQDTYQPGETASFDITVEFTETRSDEFTKVVEFYRCHDSGCDDPNRDEFLEAARDQEFYYAGAGDKVSWNVDYQVPNDESYYAAVAYIYDSTEGEVISTDPRKVFEVRQSSETLEPQLTTYQTPSYTVNDDGSVTGTVGIRNKGDGDMDQSDIVEMQVRPAGSGPLSFVSSNSQVCDSDYPENVHKRYRLDAGDSRNIRLDTGQVLEDGQSYTVYFMTRNDCYPDNEKVPPIYNSYEAGTFTFDTSDQSNDKDTTEENVVEYGKPELKYEGGKITSTVYFKNEGGDMTDRDIVEMQVRPKGTAPLNFISSTEQVCDSSHPENIHKEYELGAGEQAKISLSTSAVEKGEEYTVYLMTREGCGGDKADPYYNSKIAGNVDTGEEEVTLPDGLPVLPIAVGLIVVGVGGFLVRRSG